MLPIGNDKDGNFLFVKQGATEKDYAEVKKMNINIIEPKSDKALYNLNRITPEIANVIDIEWKLA